jgi:hypothetical protein
MSERVRIIRVLENPRKKRARKKISKRKRVRRRKSVRRRPGPRFLVEGAKPAESARYFTAARTWGGRGQAKRFSTVSDATRAMRAAAPKAEQLGFYMLKVVVA